MATTISAFLWEAVSCPFTTLTIILSCWIWVKFFVEEWDPRNFSISYNDVVRKKQFWRILSTQLSHTSLLHLLVNIMVIWNCRLTELNLGTLFVFRYSIVLAISESLLTCGLIKLTIAYTPFGPNIEPMLVSTNTFGCSGTLLGWVTYQSLLYSRYTVKKHLVLLGAMAFDQEVIVLVLAIVYYFCLPRPYIISELMGLVSGFMLAGGLLQVVPDLFWSCCLMLNVALLVASSLVNNQSTALLPRSVSDTGAELVEVHSYETADAATVAASNRQQIGYSAGDVAADLEAGVGLLTADYDGDSSPSSRHGGSSPLRRGGSSRSQFDDVPV